MVYSKNFEVLNTMFFQMVQNVTFRTLLIWLSFIRKGWRFYYSIF